MWNCIVSVARIDAPLTLEDIKAHCTGDDDQTDDDVLLEAYRLTAADVVESIAEIALTAQTRVFTADAFPAYDDPLRLPYPPIRAVTSVQYRDLNGVLQLWAAGNYDVVTSGRFAAIVPKVGTCYPTTRCRVPDAVVVTFTCGYDDDKVPARYLQAQRFLAAHWYANREPMTAATMMTLPLGFDCVIGAPARLDPCC